MTDRNDFIAGLGLLGFVTRLKRVSDSMLHDGRRLYRQLGMDIEPNWYVVFRLLEHQGPFTVTEIADRVGVAHPSMIQIVNKMIKAGYLEETRVSTDSRKRHLKLTARAAEQLPEFERVWMAGTAGLKRMLSDVDALGFLDILEERVSEKGFRERALEELTDPPAIEVVAFRPELAKDFADLNYEWINRFFAVEEPDRRVLDNPDREIIARGGAIFFVLVDGAAAGTVALINEDEETFELAKMAVSGKYRGMKIGDLLIRTCIDHAKAVGKSRICLLSNTKLIPAIRLYRKFGFVETPLDPETPYMRTNIAMELDLNSTR